MITEAQAELLGIVEDTPIDMSKPIQELFDECLNFISKTDFE